MKSFDYKKHLYYSVGLMIASCVGPGVTIFAIVIYLIFARIFLS